MTSFSIDKERGDAIENLVLQELRKKYPCTTRINGKFKGYDLWIPERGWGIEVKYDKKSNETGNYLIEYEMNGQPSALMTTTAKFWALYDDKYIVYISPQQIIRCIFDNEYTYQVKTGNGDRASKKCFLIRKNDLINYSTKTKEIQR
jgi:hypothetical protein